MNRSSKCRRQGMQGRPARWAVRPLAAACSALLLPGVVYGQQGEAVETVVVTGIRHSIESSVATKRESESIVESVTAEDLGKLPDVSIAESLARLPGLTAQRVDGRAQVISIRGLAPKFGVTLLNGREMVSTGDNRSVEYDQFPSELINSATVYKTPDAALGAQGLAGTVNMQTVRPLDFRGRQATVNVRGEKNANGELVPGSDGKGSRISASYVDQFANNTLGVALGFARLDSPNQQKYFKSWWWGNSAIWWGAFRGLENEDPRNAPSSMQGFDTGVTSTSNKRDGLMAVFEYKPNKDFRSQLDLYYSKFDQSSQGREFQADLMPNWSGNGTSGNPANGGPIYANPVTTMMGNDPVLVGGSVSNVDPYVLTRYNKREDKVFAVGWNNELKLGQWKATADLSYSKAERDEVVGEMTASATSLTGFGSFTANTTGENFSQYRPLLNYADPTIVQFRGLSGWGSLNGAPQAGSLSPIRVDDEMKALRLSAKRDLGFGPLANFEGGLNLTKRSKDTRRTQTIFALRNGTACARSGDACAPIPGSILGSPVDLGFAGIPGVVNFNLMDALGTGMFDQGPANVSQIPGRIWGVEETVNTAYAKLGLDFTAGIPIRGNVGLQVVSSDQKSTGFLWDSASSVAVPMSAGKSYTDVLPSLNLVGELTPSTYLRFGAAKVMARPNLEDMRAGFTASVATSGQQIGKWSGSGGNPNLEPWRANAYDLSLEKYFGKRSYVALAVFEKKLETSIYKADIDYDFSGFQNTSGTPAISPIGRLNAPMNGQGGYVRGHELSGALEGRLLHEALDGFGLIASYSHTSSNVPGTSNGGGIDLKRPLEGLSGEVSSIIGYYEKNGFQARIAQRFRSKFMAEVRGVWIDRSLAAIEAERITDLQLGYSFEHGPYKGLSILFQINNLNDTPYRTSLADDSSTSNPLRMMPERYYQYGRQYLIGISYKL